MHDSPTRDTAWPGGPRARRARVPRDRCGDPRRRMTCADACVILQDDTTTIERDGFAGTVDACGILHRARGA